MYQHFGKGWKYSINEKLNSCNVQFGIVFIILYSIFAIKSLYGIGWNDEAFTISLAKRFAAGDLPIIHEWNQAQLVGVLLAPIYWLYQLLEIESIVLFFRIFWLSAWGCVTILLYSTLCKYYENSAIAAVSSISMLIYQTQNKSYFSYYDLAVLFLSISIILALRAKREHKSSLYFLSGVCYCFVLFANPYAILIYFLYIVAAIYAMFVKRKSYIRDFLIFSIGAAIIGSTLIYAYNIKICSMKFWDCVHYIAFSPIHSKQNVCISMLKWIWYSIKPYSIPGILAQAILFVYVVVLLKKGALTQHIKRVIFGIEILISIVYPIVQFIFMDDVGVIGIAYIPVSILALFCFIMTEKRNWEIVMHFVVPGICLSIAFQFASDTGIYAMMTGYVIMMCAAPHIIEQFCIENEVFKSRFLKRLLLFLLIGSLVYTLFQRCFYYVRGNVVRADFCEKITEGPYKGIFFEPYSAKEYTDVISDANLICEITTDSDAILVLQKRSWTYLVIDRLSGCYNTWNVDLNDEYNELYYQINPEKIPQIIYDYDNSKCNVDSISLAGNEYKMLNCGYGKIYLKE